MAAPRGNKFAVGNKGGRNTLYKESVCDEMRKFYARDKVIVLANKIIPNELPTVEGFAIKLGVSRDTLYEWAKVHEEFSDTMSFCKLITKEFLVQNGLRGLYATNFAIFVATNMTDLKSKQEEDNSNKKPFLVFNVDKQVIINANRDVQKKTEYENDLKIE